MNRQRTRIFLAHAAFALACLICLAPVVRVCAAKGGIKKSDAQKLIASLSLLELSKGAVVVKEISPGETAATVTAGVRLGFRFVRDAAGAWRASEVRVGDRQWEDFDLLARAVGADNIAHARGALDALAAELDALALAKKQRDAEKKKKDESRADAARRDATRSDQSNAKSEESGAKKKQKNKNRSDGGQASGRQAGNDVADGKRSGKKKTGEDEKELVRGAFRVKNPESALSAMGGSAVVEAEVEGVFNLVRDGGAWRVASVKLGGEQFRDFDSIVRALDAEKTKVARADIDTLASALEAFRRERGSYVVADSETVLLDYLNPRYIEHIVRVDPWHRPYEYEGTRDAFTLRSNGADGKPNTGDDLIQRNN
jgi:hypothetical protein